jgi:uncharacterized protein (UPF0332 family)
LPEDLLDQAEERLGAARALEEAGHYSDAVGRAYYAIFAAARALLAARNQHPKTHRGVVHQFGLQFVRPGFLDEVWGRSLAESQERREELEYNPDARATREEAEDALAEAERFLLKVREALEQLRRIGEC